MKVERNRAGNKYTFTAEDKEDEKFLDKVNKKIDELEEENKNLKEFKTKREESMFYFKALAERVEPINSKEAEELQKYKKLFEKLYREELYYLEEENKNLKEEIRFLELNLLKMEKKKEKSELEGRKYWKEKAEKLQRENIELRNRLDAYELALNIWSRGQSELLMGKNYVQQFENGQPKYKSDLFK